MKERPILFSAPMVRAILDGSKTQTRRVVKRQPLVHWVVPGEVACPYGQPGDRLWVRETWAYHAQAIGSVTDEDGPFVYRATDGIQHRLCDKWRPSIHMPRWASRILLEVVSVRVERLADISKDDAMAEGIVLQPDGGFGLADYTHYNFSDPTDSYCSLWESINGAGSWMTNPWVWVVEFKRLEGGVS